MAELMMYDLSLLRVRLSVRRHGLRFVRALHAYEYAHTAGAGGVDDAWHRLLVVARWEG
jgi:hypothetical protein